MSYSNSSTGSFFTGLARFLAASAAARRQFNRIIRQQGRAKASDTRAFLERNYPDVDVDEVIAKLSDDLRRQYGA
jgi:hypothetical protein